MFCVTCGKEIHGQANFCKYCGHLVTGKLAYKKGNKEPINFETELFHFVRTNRDFYERKWRQMKKKRISWNFAAFFFGFFWLGYRKMYRNLLFGAVLFVLIWLIPYFYLHEWTAFFTGYFGICSGIFLGLLGNHLYKEHVKKKVLSVRGLTAHPEVAKSLLDKKGGNSWLGVVYACLILLGVFAFPVIVSTFIADTMHHQMHTTVLKEFPQDVDGFDTEEYSLQSDIEPGTVTMQIAMDAMDTPFNEGNYEQQVTMLIILYLEKVALFEEHSNQLTQNPNMFANREWLDGIYHDLNLMDGMMKIILEMADIPQEHQKSHKYLSDFARTSSEASYLYRQTINTGNEAIFSRTMETYKNAFDSLSTCLWLLELELQKKYY